MAGEIAEHTESTATVDWLLVMLVLIGETDWIVPDGSVG